MFCQCGHKTACVESRTHGTMAETRLTGLLEHYEQRFPESPIVVRRRACDGCGVEWLTVELSARLADDLVIDPIVRRKHRGVKPTT